MCRTVVYYSIVFLVTVVAFWIVLLALWCETSNAEPMSYRPYSATCYAPWGESVHDITTDNPAICSHGPKPQKLLVWRAACAASALPMAALASVVATLQAFWNPVLRWLQHLRKHRHGCGTGNLDCHNESAYLASANVAVMKENYDAPAQTYRRTLNDHKLRERLLGVVKSRSPDHITEVGLGTGGELSERGDSSDISKAGTADKSIKSFKNKLFRLSDPQADTEASKLDSSPIQPPVVVKLNAHKGRLERIGWTVGVQRKAFASRYACHRRPEHITRFTWTCVSSTKVTTDSFLLIVTGVWVPGLR